MITGFDKSPTNADIRGKSVLVHVRDNRAVWIAWWHPGNIWHAKSCCVNEFWLKTTSAMTYSQWVSKIQGSWKLEEDFYFLYFFTKRLTLAILQTTYIHFAIRIYRSGRLHEDEEGARVFPVNNILLYRTKDLLHFYFSSLWELL